MKLLFYYPDNHTTVPLESLMLAFKEKGHDVILLTNCHEGELHKEVRRFGVECYTYCPVNRNGFTYYLKHIYYLIRFVKTNRVDIIFSHLQIMNFISCAADFFHNSQTILCRHHSDSVYTGNSKKEKLLDTIINLLGKDFVAPSKAVYNQMVNVEKVNSKKIHLINYAYNFDLFQKPDEKKVSEIKGKYPADLVLITIGRLVPLKRHILLFKSVSNLTKEGYNLKLHVLGDGPLRSEFEQFITENKLENTILLHGHKTNIFDYMKSSDLLVHISESEASNGVVKEASLANLPVLVCKNVGDFDEYVTSENALIISKDFTQYELVEKIKNAYENKLQLKTLSSKLKQDVIEQFEINGIIHQYDQFLKQQLPNQKQG